METERETERTQGTPLPSAEALDEIAQDAQDARHVPAPWEERILALVAWTRTLLDISVLLDLDADATDADVRRAVGEMLVCHAEEARRRTTAEAERDALQARLAELQKPAPCGVCGGTGAPASGKPCICGGVGTEVAEMDGLRLAVYDEAERADKAEARLAAVEQSRDLRQRAVATWATETFGAARMALPERCARFIEEALELVQACGMPRADVGRVVEYVFSRPAGEPAQEVGGVGITLLALCEVAGVSADAAEEAELRRVQAKSVEHFRARHNAKAAAGIAAPVTEETALAAGREGGQSV